MRTAHWVAATAAAVMLLTGCGNDEERESSAPTATSQEDTAQDDAGQDDAAAPELPEPDLEGIPEVVAEVDGVQITREEFRQIYEGQFQQAAMESQMTGAEIDQDALKQQTVEGMVDTELLLAEAGDRSIEPSEEEVDAVADELAASYGVGSADELFTALEEQGLDRETALAELRMQTALNQLITAEAGELSLTEDDLRERYDAVAEQAGPDSELPEFDEVRETIEAELQREHETAAAEALVDRLREDAAITIHL